MSIKNTTVRICILITAILIFMFSLIILLGSTKKIPDQLHSRSLKYQKGEIIKENVFDYILNNSKCNCYRIYFEDSEETYQIADSALSGFNIDQFEADVAQGDTIKITGNYDEFQSIFWVYQIEVDDVSYLSVDQSKQLLQEDQKQSRFLAFVALIISLITFAIYGTFLVITKYKLNKNVKKI